jgi:F-type H+-transporting ATPase subunit alpha
MSFNSVRTLLSTARYMGAVSGAEAGIISIQGLSSVGYGEKVAFENGLFGLVIRLNSLCVTILLLGPMWRLKVGERVLSTLRVLGMPVGTELLGRIVNSLGEPLDGGVSLTNLEQRPIEVKAPNFIDRQPVTIPILTG